MVVALMVASVTVAIFYGGRGLRDKLIEGIDDFWNNFRGGPPRPMHPSPVNDGALLRRRSWKSGDKGGWRTR